MLSPQLRSQVNQLWSMFWSSGMTNPLTAIEQITYLIFLKRLETLDKERVAQGKLSFYGPRKNCTLSHHKDDGERTNALECPGHGTCRWSYIRQIPNHEQLSQYVFPWLRELETIIEEMGNGTSESNRAVARNLQDAYFQLPPEKTKTLTEAIGRVDRLFASVDQKGANSDLMGDIFEHLLSEISSSGKNGQFRTPRHIIRFLIELLNPKLESGANLTLVDPAAGSAGFLINTIQHLRVQDSPPDTVVYEWDGTPHRAVGGVGTEAALEKARFVGFDNDRTMARIGWMNLLLHGIENPEILLRDALGPKLIESEIFDLALANPPFTGNIDKDDLHPRFKIGGKKNEALTNKTELLFVWLLLDLLKVGGRAAVIVPEGVLFGSTGAHRELRRQLLFEHELEAVISLPGGVFQPYTGVKTSILLFQKVGQKRKREELPRKNRVWFYEVEADGFSLDAKRNGQPMGDNDLWDALHKYRNLATLGESEEYFQPEVYQTRWRTVDGNLVAAYPALSPEGTQLRGIRELWSDLSENPDEATKTVSEASIPVLEELLTLHYSRTLAASANKRGRKPTVKKLLEDALKDLKSGLIGASSTVRGNLERGEGGEEHAWKALRSALDTFETHVFPPDAADEATFTLPSFLKAGLGDLSSAPSSANLFEGAVGNNNAAESLLAGAQLQVIQAFMKLDGYNIHLLRSRNVAPSPKPDKKKPRSWFVDVRVWARRDDWTNKDETVTGSHDEKGKLRPEFLADDRIYHADGTVKAEYLELGCIEADELNISAGRYRPMTLSSEVYAPPAEIIKGLQAMETRIQEKLARLLSMVESGA